MSVTSPSPHPRPNPWLLIGVCLGLAMVFVPFTWSIVSVSRASDIHGGLRQATVTKGKEGQVSTALGTASIAALTIPPGILLTVMCGLGLVRKRPLRHRPDDFDADSL